MKTLIALLMLVPVMVTAQFVQLSSAIDQRPATTDPVIVTMEQVDNLNNLTVVNDSVIRVHTHGNYFAMAAPQCGRLKGGDKENIRCWLRVNGLDVPNSNVLLVLGQGDKDVIVSQGIVTLNAGNELQVMIAVSDPKDGVGIEAIDIPGEPLVPSIIFSMFKIQ